MLNPVSPTSTSDALPAVRAALKMMPGVDRVSTSRSGTLVFLKVNVAGCRVLAAAVYPVAGVVVPLAAVPDHLQLNDAVCGAANAYHLTILHGVRDHMSFSESPSELGRFLPNEAQFIREGELAMAQFIREDKLAVPAMALEMAQAERLLVDLAGTSVRTGVALLTGAPLEMRTLDFPLVDAEVIERRCLEGIIRRPQQLENLISMRMGEIKGQDSRIARAQEQILMFSDSKRRLTADVARARAELAALCTPEAERERLEAAALLRGEVVPAS